jgi:hypothetical protein
MKERHVLAGVIDPGTGLNETGYSALAALGAVETNGLIRPWRQTRIARPAHWASARYRNPAIRLQGY